MGVKVVGLFGLLGLLILAVRLLNSLFHKGIFLGKKMLVACCNQSTANFAQCSEWMFLSVSKHFQIILSDCQLVSLQFLKATLVGLLLHIWKYVYVIRQWWLITYIVFTKFSTSLVHYVKK
jgi:hypothetical protein